MTNWVERIEEAKENGRFNIGDMVLSVTWDTCATSTVPGISRWLNSGAPRDSELLALGGRFAVLVNKSDIKGAEACYNQILERGRQIRQMVTTTENQL